MEIEKNEYEFFQSPSSVLLNTTMINEAFGRFSKWFWNPDFWLPVNFTWEEIQPREDFHYPNCKDILIYPAYAAAFLLFCRYFISNPYIFYPLASYFHLNLRRPPHPEENKELEKLYYKYNHKVPKKVSDRVAYKLNCSSTYVQKWLLQKKFVNRETAGEKFADSGFKLLAHGFYCFLGFYVLYDKEWVWDISHCWKKYPHHEIDPDVWFYYMFGLGLYLSVTVHQLMQPSRKDRLSMYLHHTFTITLIALSWSMNFVRIGTLVILVHQCVDWLFLTTKLLTYLKMESLTNLVFALTFVVWIVSRIIVYPFWILKSTFFEGPTYMFMPSAYLFFTLLLGLLFLNLMWFVMMIMVIVRKIQYGKIKDVRSSDEEMEEDEPQSKKIQ